MLANIDRWSSVNINQPFDAGVHLDLVKGVEFAMDVARGMSCLHAQKPIIIHRWAYVTGL